MPTRRLRGVVLATLTIAASVVLLAPGPALAGDTVAVAAAQVPIGDDADADTRRRLDLPVGIVGLVIDVVVVLVLVGTVLFSLARLQELRPAGPALLV